MSELKTLTRNNMKIQKTNVFCDFCGLLKDSYFGEAKYLKTERTGMFSSDSTFAHACICAECLREISKFHNQTLKPIK